MRFLVLNHSLREFAGSEVNALQLAAGLRSLGHHADLATFDAGPPVSTVAARLGLTVLDLLPAEGPPLAYDVVWAHHAPLLTHLLVHRPLGDCRLVFSSLSPLTPLESPPYFLSEIGCVLAHSPFNRDYLLGLGLPPDRLHYFPNFAPARFFAQPKPRPAAVLQTIAVVSNHPPAEVRRFADLARRAGLRVDFIGRHRHARYIDETVLPGYDLVVAIGKTAPYCFAQKIPYYCYDHFGGPGYLTPENFAAARHGNFCGRSF